MLKKVIYGLAIAAVLVLIVYAALSVYSRRAPQLGLVDGKLRACPGRPNCVCSEPPESANVAPLRFADEPLQAWERLAALLRTSGGQIMEHTPQYLHATFESRYFRFVDDFEARLEAGQGVIHVRSASRVGYGDRGLNRNRIESLRARYAAPTGPDNQ